MFLLLEEDSNETVRSLYKSTCSYNCINCGKKISFYNTPPFMCSHCFELTFDVTTLKTSIPSRAAWHSGTDKKLSLLNNV